MLNIWRALRNQEQYCGRFVDNMGMENGSGDQFHFHGPESFFGFLHLKTDLFTCAEFGFAVPEMQKEGSLLGRVMSEFRDGKWRHL